MLLSCCGENSDWLESVIDSAGENALCETSEEFGLRISDRELSGYVCEKQSARSVNTESFNCEELHEDILSDCE